jgi:hypothetical protein
MFETHDTARLPYMAGEGEHFWSRVSIHLQRAWFQVTYMTTVEDDVVIAETLFLSRIKQLLDINKHNNIKITFVDLVSPGFMNGCGRWKMEPLREIRLCVSEENPNQQDYVYLLESGERYRDIGVASSENEFREDQLIFRTPLVRMV